MISIKAAQLIYTRVELPYSAQRKNGFQTVYKSELLSTAEVAEIEEGVQCFHPKQAGMVRYQYLSLKSGLVVLAHTTEIRAHPEIIDRTRPEPVSLAHCLVLHPEEFGQIDNYPFILYENFDFLKDAEEMVARFGQATGVALPVEIPVQPPPYTAGSDWPGVEALKLVTLAMRADELSKKGQSVFLTGDQNNINETLRTVFLLLKPDQRLGCTFNTYIDGCSLKPGTYWAMGTTSAASRDGFIRVNTTNRRVIDQAENSGDDKDLYMKWLTYACLQGNLSMAMPRAFTAQALALAFEKRSNIDPNRLDPETCREFIRLNEEYIIQSLKSTLVEMVGKDVATPFSYYMFKTTETWDLLNIAASQSLDPLNLSQWVVNWLVGQKPDIKDGQLKDLRELARRTGNTRLLYLTATLTTKVDTKVRDEALSNMDEMTFEQTLSQLRNPIAPANFVTPAHLDRLLIDKRLVTMSAEELVDLVEAIVKADKGGQLERLIQYIQSIEGKPLVHLEKIIKKRPNISPEFEVAVCKRIEELGLNQRWFRLF